MTEGQQRSLIDEYLSAAADYEERSMRLDCVWPWKAIAHPEFYYHYNRTFRDFYRKEAYQTLEVALRLERLLRGEQNA